MATNHNKSSTTSSKNKSSKGNTKKSSTKKSSANKNKGDSRYDSGVYHDEITLIISLVVSILLILSNFHLSGKFGIFINWITFGIFGYLTYLLPYILFIGVAFCLSNRGNKKAIHKLVSCNSLLVILTAFLQLLSTKYVSSMTLLEYYKNSASNKNGGGLIGGVILKVLCPLFGELGAYVILSAIMIVLLMFITEKAFFASIGKKGAKSYETYKERKQLLKEQRELEEEELEDNDTEEVNDLNKRKAKTFTLKKPEVNIDEQTVKETEQLESNEKVETGFFKSRKVKNKNKKENKETNTASQNAAYEMDEFLPADIDNIPIHRDTQVIGANVESVYEEELRKKFSDKGNDYDIKALANQLMMAKDISEDVLSHDIPIQKEEISFSKSEFEGGDNHEKDIVNIEYDKESIVKDELISTSEDGIDFTKHAEVMNPTAPEELDHKGLERNNKDSGNNNVGHDSNETSRKVIEAHNSAKNPNGLNQNSNINHNHAEQNNNTSAETIQIEKAKEVIKEYKYPPIDLLAKPKATGKGITDFELKETALKLQKTLESFGVRVTITNVSCGPAVTRYELQPEQGVKVSKITSLADDIKLNLAAADIRIEAPIPGKAAVGIEVPNKVNTAVMFRDLIENLEFKKHPSDIAFAVGKDIGGQTVVTDIAKMPHLLIAGATGSGKSVCINTLIMSILYKANPADVKLIMVDPKVVELSVYNGIPHLLIPVVTDPKKASAALNWAVMEMTDRYQKFAELGVRDIKGYNEKIAKVEHLEDEKYQKMPQIVIIVDELADLMMVAPGEVEDAICRLAQMARAAGLHLIIATQRPSVNVITGLIKANVPSRIAFSVSSAIDSRTIIDGSGAEKLLGKGDMLFFPSGYPKPVRIQGAFVSDKEVSDVVEFLASQNSSNESQYSAEIANKITSVQTTDSLGNSQGNDRDDYFIEAGKFIIDKDKASIGMLQRVYKIGFNRAARIMDQLYEAGVVGPEEGTKPRKVLMSIEEFEQYVDEYV